MLAVTVPFIHLVHETMLLRHGGRAGLRYPRAIARLVETAPPREGRRGVPSMRSATELAAHYLGGLVRQQPFRDQNDTTGWCVAMYVLRERGYFYTPPYGAMPLMALASMKAAATNWPDDEIATWLEQGTQVLRKRTRAA